MPEKDTFGELYIVATPIGNLQDMTLRAIEVLRSVDLIAAEDTRHSAKLLSTHAINTPLVSYHDHNEVARSGQLVDKLKRGKDVALISDAGTPVISDPGYRLMDAAIGAGVKIIPIPGPCAAIAALSVAGLPAERFAFEGFLPARSAARRRRLMDLGHESRTLVIYESPRRALACLLDIRECIGPNRSMTVAREISKQYETIKRGVVDECVAWMRSDPQQQKGEMVFVLEGRDDPQPMPMRDAEDVLGCLLDELPLKRAAALAARITGLPKNDLYKLGLAMRQGDHE